jgi:hypothetical protein
MLFISFLSKVNVGLCVHCFNWSIALLGETSNSVSLYVYLNGIKVLCIC